VGVFDPELHAARFEVPAVGVEVRARLLDDEHLGTQPEDRVERARVELAGRSGVHHLHVLPLPAMFSREADRWRVNPGTKVSLDSIDPASTAGAPGDKKRTERTFPS